MFEAGAEPQQTSRRRLVPRAAQAPAASINVDAQDKRRRGVWTVAGLASLAVLSAAGFVYMDGPSDADMMVEAHERRTNARWQLTQEETAYLEGLKSRFETNLVAACQEGPLEQLKIGNFEQTGDGTYELDFDRMAYERGVDQRILEMCIQEGVQVGEVVRVPVYPYADLAADSLDNWSAAQTQLLLRGKNLSEVER